MSLTIYAQSELKATFIHISTEDDKSRQRNHRASAKYNYDWPVEFQPQNPVPLPADLRDKVGEIVKNPKCGDFIKNLIGAAAKDGKAFSDNPMDLFDRVEFKLKNISNSGEANFEGNKRVGYINPVPYPNNADPRLLEHIQYAYAVTALNELMHHARQDGLYNDRTLAVAAFKLLTPEEQLAHPLPDSNDVKINSDYFHPIFNSRCKSVTGE